MIVSQTVDDLQQVEQQTRPSTTHTALQWHPTRDILAVASVSQTGGYVSFVTHKGGDSFFTTSAVPDDQPLHLLWHPHEPRLVIGWASGRLSTTEPLQGTEKELSVERTGAIRCIGWDPEARLLFSGDQEGHLRHYDLVQNEAKPSGHVHLEGHSIALACMKSINLKRENLTKTSGNDELTEILASNRRRKQEQNEVSENEANSLVTSDQENVTIVATDKCALYLIRQNQEPILLYSTQSPVKTMLSMGSKQYIVLLSEDLMFYQLVFDNFKVDDKIKVKLTGRREYFDAIQVEQDTVAMCYGDREIRVWDLHAEDSAVYRVDQGKGYQGTEQVVTLGYSKKKSKFRSNCISGGTSTGRVATWKRHKENYDLPVDQQWRLQPALSVGIKVMRMAWSNVTPTLAVSSGDSVQIFRTQGVEYYVNGDYAVVQTSPQIVSLVRITEPVETQEVHFSYTLKGFRIMDSTLVTWEDNQVTWRKERQIQVYVNEITCVENNPMQLDQVNQFVASVSVALPFSQQIYSIEKGQLCVRTLQGTLKKTLTFREGEGEAHLMDVNNKWLCLGSTACYIRIYSLEGSNIKQVYQSTQLNQNFRELDFAQIRVNCLGNKVSISMQTKDQLNDRLFVWDAEADVLGHFSFSEGLTDQQQYENSLALQELGKERPKTAATKIIERDQTRYRMLGRVPTNHYWDQNDGRFLCCEASKVDSDESLDFILTLFVTSEYGIQAHDIHQKSIKADQMIWVDVPYVYFLKNVEVDEEDHIQVERSVSRLILRTTLREFVGISDTDKAALEAMMNFSFYLCAEQMDNAFKAIKFIKNDMVWDHMARMCVKTRRIDVAIVCLGHMRNARAVRAVKESMTRGEDLEMQTAVLAIELDMLDEARAIYLKAERYDLLNKLYQAENNWNEAFQIAKKHDRIHLRNTHFNYANYLESIGEIEQAIDNYEKSQTHHFEVPRMLREEPKAVDLYVKRKRERELYLWWARYLESIDDLEGARNYYKYANDNLSVVRILCYHDCIDEAIETINKTDDRAAAFHMARYFEARGDVEKAVQYFEKAACYVSAIRLAKEHGMHDQLANYALHAGGNELVETAKYYEDMDGHVDKAVMLYHKAGLVGRALDLAFRTEQISALDPILKDLGPDSDPEVLKRAAHFFAQNQRQNEAVQLLVYAQKFSEAVDMCLHNNVIIDDKLADILTPPRSDPNRKNLLTEIARCCLQQGNYHFAAKKYTQAGRKVEAMKALLRSGDTPKIVLYANTAKDKTIYALAGNYLQSLNWKEDATLMRQIENFYMKANALDSLAAFYESCGQLEIDDYRDYDKGLAAYNESLKCWAKKEEKETSLGQKEAQQRDQLKLIITKIKQFLESRMLYDKDPGTAMTQLTSMAEEPDIDNSVRVGDIYAVLIGHNVKREHWKKAYQLIQQYQSKRLGHDISVYLNDHILDEICDQNQAPRLSRQVQSYDDDEIENDIQYSHALRRKMSQGNSEAELSD